MTDISVWSTVKTNDTHRFFLDIKSAQADFLNIR